MLDERVVVFMAAIDAFTFTVDHRDALELAGSCWRIERVLFPIAR
jgi:hypothetical protein